VDRTEIEKVVGVSVSATVDKENEKLAEFSEMLESIMSLESKKKLLWIHIYENALQDRRNAYALLFELVGSVKGKSSDHLLKGPILAKYIERMSRANDQILKLAELIEKAQTDGEKINPDDIYSQYNKEG